MSETSVSFVAECFWTGVTEQDVHALEERIRAAVSDLASSGQRLHYSGSLVMPTDEVVLCLFEGPEQLLRLAAQRAGVPFERIVQSSTHHGLTPPKGADAI